MNAPLLPRIHYLVTAEHASPTTPSECGSLLETFLPACEAHQVWDPGAKLVAEEIAGRLACPCVLGEHTRLAVDLNRSIGSGAQFSPPLFQAPEPLKAELLSKYFLPFRQRCLETVERACQQEACLLHLSVHSFTKRFFGQPRSVDLGILFDAHRPFENQLGQAWVKALRAVLPDYDVQCNQPYDGAEDGHTTALRRRYPENRYLGFEIELSQDLDMDSDAEAFAKILVTTLHKALLKTGLAIAS